ncbi:hypothetical protein [Streptomyces sp. WMMC1477]|uniref:hypothetical protein n=1 Tax=Streptomyces sp. WMMC1477 TaxID=3015155 RepID=UPI0022B6A7FF|nr:hypothetical protein [Streptomyces sp. WMMC1477]MCZ7430122.1 hypothetical protein [Streptomyces sp. WMMC1477]
MFKRYQARRGRWCRVAASCPHPATARPTLRPADRPQLATGIALAATAASLLDLQASGLPDTAVHAAVAVVVFTAARLCAAWSLMPHPHLVRGAAQAEAAGHREELSALLRALGNTDLVVLLHWGRVHSTHPDSESAEQMAERHGGMPGAWVARAREVTDTAIPWRWVRCLPDHPFPATTTVVAAVEAARAEAIDTPRLAVQVADLAKSWLPDATSYELAVADVAREALAWLDTGQAAPKSQPRSTTTKEVAGPALNPRPLTNIMETRS